MSGGVCSSRAAAEQHAGPYAPYPCSNERPLLKPAGPPITVAAQLRGAARHLRDEITAAVRSRGGGGRPAWRAERAQGLTAGVGVAGGVGQAAAAARAAAEAPTKGRVSVFLAPDSQRGIPPSGRAGGRRATSQNARWPRCSATCRGATHRSTTSSRFRSPTSPAHSSRGRTAACPFGSARR